MKVSSHLSASRLFALPAACLLVISGCDKTPGTQVDYTTVKQPAQAATAAPAVSNVPVTGNEPLPPKHPPLPNLPAAHPPMPASSDSQASNAQFAEQHPQPSNKGALAVSVPEEVRKAWSAVNLVVSGADGKEQSVRVRIGETLKLDKATSLRVVNYLPAYTSDFKTATSTSSEPKNPAIQVETSIDGKPGEQGWVFQLLPEFNSYRSDKIKIRLVSAEPAAK
jgi:hypothetical protein